MRLWPASVRSSFRVRVCDVNGVGLAPSQRIGVISFKTAQQSVVRRYMFQNVHHVFSLTLFTIRSILVIEIRHYTINKSK